MHVSRKHIHLKPKVIIASAIIFRFSGVIVIRSFRAINRISQ